MFQDGRALLLLFIISASNAQSFFDLLKSYMNPMEGISTIYSPRYKEYDFIIVGSGSGGSVLANRLSENSNWKILLLEAGDVELLVNQVPMACVLAQLTKQNWGYTVTPQKNCCLGMINRQCSFPRGRVTGGSSVLNYMIHTRGNKLDYDIWAALGNKGWSYQDVLPYFKKSERFKVPGRIDYTYHNQNGHLCVEHAPYHTELATAFLKAGQELGYDVVDYNGERQVGFSYLQLNMDQGARCSAATAYLRNLQRPNLDIVLGARVTRVLIDKNKRAYGVEYVKNNKWQSVRSKKETILSAGTIDSAKLLMLSGIGPKSHLEKLGINVIQDLKVGYNLYEHVGFLGLVFKINASLSLLPTTFMNPAVPLNYAKDRGGPISIPGGAEAISFMRTKYAQDSRPDVELLFIAGSMHSDNGLFLKRALRITDEVYNGFYKPLELQHAWSIWPIVQHPRSVGVLTLKSKNPFDDPIIETNFLTHPADIEIILEGVKHAINVSKTAAFQAYGSTIWDKKIPGCEKYEFGSDDYWRCAIKYLPSMMNHEIGTCKMGPKSDPDAVVDPELKVYGIENLRVIDASIMPTMPNGHVNAGIYMIGEKAADMIKNQWRR